MHLSDKKCNFVIANQDVHRLMTTSTICFIRNIASRFASQRYGGLAQLARALAWHARGHRFDSDILHYPHPVLEWFCKRGPFTLRKGPFYRVIRALLPTKRGPFTTPPVRGRSGRVMHGSHDSPSVTFQTVS